jgi:hypothetical protein
MVMALAAASALDRLPQFSPEPAVGGHDVRELMQARVLALRDVRSIRGSHFHLP